MIPIHWIVAGIRFTLFSTLLWRKLVKKLEINELKIKLCGRKS